MHGATPHDEPMRIGLGPLLRLAGPVVLSRLGIMGMGLVDTIVVGRYSATELGYNALGWAPTAVVLTTSIGLLSGVQVLTSQAIGEGRASATGAILRYGALYALLIGLAACVILAGLGGPLLEALGMQPGLAKGATPVLQLFAVSLIPILIADVGVFWLEAHGRPLPATLALWVTNAINLALNLWLVPGTSGLPVAGAVASAWSTLISRLALLALIWGLIAAWPAAREMGVFRKAPRDTAMTAELRRIGYGAAGSYFIESLAFSAMAVIAGWIGAVAVASWAIVINLAALVFMVPLGLATATSVLVGRAYGARDPAGVAHAGRIGFAATTVVMLAISAAIAIGNEWIAAAYTRDVAVQMVTAAALLLACLFFAADGLQVVAAQACRAQSDVWMPMTTHLASYTVVMMPLGYLLAIPMGLAVDGIVWAIVAASLLSAVLLWGRFVMLVRRLPG
ncbi:MATE family efflux transporter [alpha proteobacterium AAP81b]|nr:MATE family efflux transporter [alpha proteobacterium AAP81b]